MTTWEIAQHEAAHFVLSAALGVRAIKVSITTPSHGPQKGSVRAKWSPALEISAGIRTGAVTDRTTVRTVRRLLIGTCAGIALDREIGTDCDPACTEFDFNRERRLARAITPEFPEETIAWYIRVARRLVRRYLPLIYKFATALLAAPNMTIEGDPLRDWENYTILCSRCSPFPDLDV
jgi:hypothetical protein